MNTCKYCNFTGDPEKFTRPNGSVCKKCFNKHRREQRKNNHDQIIKQEEDYRKKNRERINKQSKKYRENNIERIDKHRRERLEENQDQINKQHRENRKKNRNKINEQERDYRKKNRGRINKQRRENRKNNREETNKKQREYRENNRERINEQARKRFQENSEHKRQLRKENYYRNHERELERNRIASRKRGILPWTEIKSLRFGLYIEQTIARTFGSVAEPHNNPDIDFVCPQGYKIQVKVSSMRYSYGKYPNWAFDINKNKIADYFILVAVNNSEDIDKENFKPLHIWMMKGYLLNRKSGTGISPSRISKWNKYSIMEEYENKFVTCCNTIKKKKDDYHERI